MKAFTICNPYPELILRLEKPIENRDRRWHFRGEILIHAGKSHSFMGDDDYKRYPNLSWGAIVGVMTIVECLELENAGVWPAAYAHLSDHEHADGPWCLILENVKRFKRPIPCRGAQGIWYVPNEVQPLVRQQLQEVA